jgi:hypothetical protein
MGLRDIKGLKFKHAMKKLFLFLMIGLSVWSCEEEDLPANNCIQVKLIMEVCGNAILQVVDPAYYDIAEDSWQKSNGDILTHVFSTNLACQPTPYPADGSVFNIKVESQMPQTFAACGVCQALLPESPETFHWVSIQTDCATSEPVLD